MNGIILLDKPAGFTSFDAVAKMRGILKMRHIGHGGTLDPMARGVLPILLGTATRVCDIVPDPDKKYRAVMRLGITTDTEDITGKVLTRSDVNVSEADVLAVLPSFTGNITQIPPMYSAVQVGGVRLYNLARKGITVDRPAREITVYSISLVSSSPEENEYTLDVSCSKGSYIRTLVADIGKKLGCGGCLSSLVRTEAFGFPLESCRTFEEISSLSSDGRISEILIPTDSVFAGFPAYELSKEDAKLHLNGVRIYLSRLSGLPETDGLIRIYSGGEFLSLSKRDDSAGELVPVKYFFVREA